MVTTVIPAPDIGSQLSGKPSLYTMDSLVK